MADKPELLLTVYEAADLLGIPRWLLGRAVRSGKVPSYSPFNARRRVRLSEVIAIIESSRR